MGCWWRAKQRITVVEFHLVMLPPALVSDAVAVMATLAGAVNFALLAGAVMVAVGATYGVPRIGFKQLDRIELSLSRSTDGAEVDKGDIGRADRGLEKLPEIDGH